MNKIMY